MAKIEVIKTKIKDLLIVRPTVFSDARGYFTETFHREEYRLQGIPNRFVQDNESCSSKGVLRGLHFQTKHPQAKLVRVIRGRVYDVAVDLRRDSETFGQWEGILLSGENKTLFYIPEGFAHGFLVLEDETVFSYKCSDYYDPSGEGGIRYDDGSLAIPWNQYYSGEILISEKDKLLPSFEDWKAGNLF